MIIRYPKCLLENLKVNGELRGRERGKCYREILEELDEEYISYLISSKKVDSTYYRKILKDIDNEYVKEVTID